MKTLVVYYSRTGTTRAVGKAIAKELGGDVDEIIDLKKRTGLRPFRWIIAGKDAWRKNLTKIETKKKPEDYDLVIIGTPVWAGKMSPAVRTYLTNHNFEGKKVGLFCTALRDTEKVFGEMKGLIPKASIVGTLGLHAREVKSNSHVEKIKSFVKILRGREK